jgi:HK97 family phage prohead protease
MPKPFVFNDQNQKNSYGFRILTSGISLKRFANNPMMLDQHYNSTQYVLGKWENWRADNDLLLGDPLFDVEDPQALKISGKVDRGFINSCSMGITFNREDLKIIGDELIMEKCELYEVSIVAVPSNANSIRLYADNGELMKDEDVKQLCLSLQPEAPEAPKNTELQLNPLNMKKIILSAAVFLALGFDKSVTEAEPADIESAVLGLQKRLTTAEAKNLAYETEKENAQSQAIVDAVDLAIKEGRIPATKKEDFVKLGTADLALLTSTLAAIPAKQTLSNAIVPAVAGDVKTKEDFQKLSLEAQLAFKTDKPEEYNKLFNVKN